MRVGRQQPDPQRATPRVFSFHMRVTCAELYGTAPDAQPGEIFCLHLSPFLTDSSSIGSSSFIARPGYYYFPSFSSFFALFFLLDFFFFFLMTQIWKKKNKNFFWRGPRLPPFLNSGSSSVVHFAAFLSLFYGNVNIFFFFFAVGLLTSFLSSINFLWNSKKKIFLFFFCFWNLGAGFSLF